MNPPSAKPVPWRAALRSSLLFGGMLLALFGLKFLPSAPQWLFGAPLPPEMLFNIAGHTLGTPAIFNLIHSLPFGLDAYAKYGLFAATFVLYLGLWYGVGYGLVRYKVSILLSLGGSVLFSVSLSGLLLLPLQGLGFFGVSGSNYLYPPLLSALWSAGLGALFALLLNGFPPQRFSLTRRESLRTLAAGAVAFGILGTVGNLFRGGLARAQSLSDNLFGRVRGLRSEITSVEEHYNVSKNVIDPSVDASRWRLRLTGLVNNELTFSLDDLKGMPSVEQATLLTCVSNQVGGNLIGNSIWTGVRLRDLLIRAGVREGAQEVILRAADNYSDSFPLEAALRDSTLVAYLQNGEPLTRAHGFPVRILVPDIYGMKNVKWLTEIELSDTEYLGYWQTRGWSDSAIIKTQSQIHTTEATPLGDGLYAVAGIAYAGLRGISAVEVSTDGGTTWAQATVKPALNEVSWQQWLYTWAAQPGSYSVVVRATDGSGEMQTAEVAPPLPDGASGYHRVQVRVA